MHISSFDDETFRVQWAQALDRSGLLQLQLKVTSEKEEAEHQVRLAKSQAWTTGHFSNPTWFRNTEGTVLRKKQQLRWISTRLAELRKQRQDKAQAENRTFRPGSFYEHFFRLCEEELEERDFHELCEVARQRAGEHARRTQRP